METSSSAPASNASYSHCTHNAWSRFSGKNERWEKKNSFILYNTVRSGMTDSQRSADKGNLCLFDATFAHTGRQVKSDMWKQKIKRTVSFHLCNAACVWRLCGEATFSFGVSHWHYKQRPLEKKPTYASIADASYGAHIAHLHIVATLLGAGLDCFLHSEVSCAGNIPQRF